jgi:hypothetical protein
MSNTARYCLSITPDTLSLNDASQREWTQLFKAALIETIKKTDLYIKSSPETGWSVRKDAPAWWQGSIVTNGEVVQFRWTEGDEDDTNDTP